ncbi:MAG: hypothetical protein ACK5HE_03455 [Bacteroidota bacterium]|jgi:hypothetical protein
MKFNKAIFTLMLPLAVFAACDTYKVHQRSLQNRDVNHEDMYGAACPGPIYIATMGVDATTSDTITEQRTLTLYNLLAVAKKKYGEDVTIQNVRWDVKNKKNISAIFDVIKCK